MVARAAPLSFLVTLQGWGWEVGGWMRCDVAWLWCAGWSCAPWRHACRHMQKAKQALPAQPSAHPPATGLLHHAHQHLRPCCSPPHTAEIERCDGGHGDSCGPLQREVAPHLLQGAVAWGKHRHGLNEGLLACLHGPAFAACWLCKSDTQHQPHKALPSPAALRTAIAAPMLSSAWPSGPRIYCSAGSAKQHSARPQNPSMPTCMHVGSGQVRGR